MSPIGLFCRSVDDDDSGRGGGYGEYPLGLVDELVAGQGLEDARVYPVASLGNEAGNHRRVDHKVFDPKFALRGGSRVQSRGIRRQVK